MYLVIGMYVCSAYVNLVLFVSGVTRDVKTGMNEWTLLYERVCAVVYNSIYRLT